MKDYNVGHALTKKCIRIQTKNDKKLKYIAEYSNKSESYIIDLLIDDFKIEQLHKFY